MPHLSGIWLQLIPLKTGHNLLPILRAIALLFSNAGCDLQLNRLNEWTALCEWDPAAVEEQNYKKKNLDLQNCILSLKNMVSLTASPVQDLWSAESLYREFINKTQCGVFIHKRTSFWHLTSYFHFHHLLLHYNVKNLMEIPWRKNTCLRTLCETQPFKINIIQIMGIREFTVTIVNAGKIGILGLLLFQKKKSTKYNKRW